MDLIPSIENLRQEAAVILAAPHLFALALLAIGSVIWLRHHLIYDSRFRSQEERLKRKDDQIARLEKKNTGMPMAQQLVIADALPSALAIAMEGNKPSKSPLCINFEGSFFEIVPENSTFDIDAKRRRYYIFVRNISSTKTVQNVTVDIESITILPNHPDDPPARKVITAQRLSYEDGTFEKVFPPKRDHKIWFLSHAQVMFDHENIRIEPSGPVFSHESKQLSICVKVTAAGYPQETLELRGWVNDGVFKVAWPPAPLYQALHEYKERTNKD
jgi:hypothetical protein